MAAIVEVKLELGHRAKVRDVPSPAGHTHDWIVFVKGSDGIDLEHFVEKVVFWLHESYDPSKRVIRRAPYKVEESGFAGFIILIDVHFRNHEEPKMVRFQYDLFLLTEAMPPVNHTRLEKLTFTNPTEDFRKKLLKAGASSSPSSKISTKERFTNPSSPKKDRSRSKDSSKRRDGSSHRSHDEKKRSSSAHSIRKDGRIPGKDMKKHEDDFKHPKPPDYGRTYKDSPGLEKIDQERGRSEKRRSTAADNEGSKKKKKKHSDDHSSPSHQSRPKSLPVSSGPPSQNPPKKEKVRKIREKPDLMAGLFAPENSINMTQIKQLKEKIKQDTSDVKIKKEKKGSTPNSAASRSVSPHHVQDDGSMTHSSKISPGGNLTLKIKKERIAGTEEKKKAPSNPPSKPRKREQNEKERRSKDSTEISSKSKVKSRESEQKKKRTPVASSSTSSSSTSGSDMDISNNSDSSSDSESKHRKPQVIANTGFKAEKSQRTPESQSFSREHQRLSSKQEKKLNSSSSSHDKIGKVKTEWERPKDSPKASTERQEKPRRNSTSHQEKSSSATKLKKSSRDEQNKFSVEKSNSESSSSHKSKKRSSKEKVRQSLEGKNSTPLPPPIKKEKRSSTPSSTPVSEQVTVKKEPKYQTPPQSSYQKAVSPAANMKIKKSPKPSSAPPKEKDRTSKKQNTSHRKLSTGSTAKPSPQRYEKSKLPKSRSFVETSSDSDSDVEPPLKHVSLDAKREGFTRKDSVSSQSSASSSQPTPSPDMSPEGVSDKNQVQHQQEYHHSPPKKRKDSLSSNSDSSDDEEMAMREFPPNTSTLSVISPIRDQSSSYIQNPKDSAFRVDDAFQDMEMSESSDDNSDHIPMQGNIQENHHPSEVEDVHHTPLQNIGMNNVNYSSSSDDENQYPPEKPFQHHQDSQDLNSRSSASQRGDSPNVIILTGDSAPCPPMTDSVYRELQELQRRISYVTDVERLRKIARIVAKSHKLLKNDDYFDFDLCSLDSRTIHKIQKQLEAV